MNKLYNKGAVSGDSESVKQIQDVLVKMATHYLKNNKKTG